MSRLKEIKALNKLEFAATKANGAIYGKCNGVYAYVELGKEEEYIERPNDNPKTEYRFFINCTVEYSETKEQSNQGTYQFKEVGINVIVYW